VLQDAWVRAFEHLGQFEGRSQFATWVTKIAVYEALARTRKRKKLVSLEDSDGNIMLEAEQVSAITDDPEKQTVRTEMSQMLQSAVDQLPGHYRSVFMLRAVEQLSTAETAECLSMSEEAVKTRLHRSRALLRSHLEDRLGREIATSFAFLGQRCNRTVAAVMTRIHATTT
jgi:RNA polymerase sigma-70 factor (ECF subfamily)